MPDPHRNLLGQAGKFLPSLHLHLRPCQESKTPSLLVSTRGQCLHSRQAGRDREGHLSSRPLAAGEYN